MRASLGNNRDGFSTSTSAQNPMSRYNYSRGNDDGQGTVPHETLLSQYKKCTQINNEALRNARNLEEVVKIKVQAIDSTLGASGMPLESQMYEGQFPDPSNSHGNQKYDFKFDPIHFRQKVPGMADRGFLINQAILSSSNQTKNLAFQGQVMQSRGATAGTQNYGILGSLGSIGSPPMSLPETTKNKYRKGVSQFSRGGPSMGTDHEGRLFSGDATTQGAVEMDEQMVHEVKTEAADDYTQADSAPLDEPIDPINQLKSIFKPKEKMRRPKLELNPVMNKYRQKNHSSSQQFRSQRSTQNTRGTRNYGGMSTYNGGKIFKEDMISAPGGDDYQSQMQQYQKLPQLQSVQNQNQPLSHGFGGDQASVRTSHQDGKSIKDRLESLRKLFAEEDINETVKGIQHDWELEDQKISLQKNRHAKSGFSQTQPFQAPASGVDNQQNFQVNDLRGYLTKKIQQVQERCHPDELQREQFSGIRGEGEIPPDTQFKFKASTLTHIAELKKFGQEKIENHFIERLFKQQTGFHYEQYEYQKQKECSRQATMAKNRPKNLGSSLVQSDILAAEHESQSRQRFRTKKPQNIVQEQLMKIEKINRESEKQNKLMQQEVRNQEIYDIIQDTQDQMRYGATDLPLDPIQTQISSIGLPGSQHSKSPKRSQSRGKSRQKQEQVEQSARMDPEIKGLLGTRLLDTGRINEIQDKNVISQDINHYKDADKAPINTDHQIKTNDTKIGSPSSKSKSPDIQNITSKVNIADATSFEQAPGHAGADINHAQFRVSQMVQDYNINAEPAYASDTELYVNKRARGTMSPESRGGGFKDNRPKWRQVGAKQNAVIPGLQENDQNLPSYKAKMMRGSNQLAEIEEDVLDKDITNGSSFSYFCPKRFNRYPRFTIFFKKDQAGNNNTYVAENTVSLSPQFLSYLMDKNSVMRNPIIQQSTKAQQSTMEFEKSTNPGGFQDSRALGNNYEKLQANTGNGGQKAPEDAVIGWNQKNEAVQNYDPFEKVVLVKGIDNSILTSFRTLKRENNTVSDTFKIVHQKFLPNKQKGQYFKQLQKNQGNNLALYPHSDNEDALEFAHAELLAESLLHQGDDTQLVKSPDDTQILSQDANGNIVQITKMDGNQKQTVASHFKGPVIRPNLDQVAEDALSNGTNEAKMVIQASPAARRSGVDPLSIIQSENISQGQGQNNISPRQAVKAATNIVTPGTYMTQNMTVKNSAAFTDQKVKIASTNFDNSNGNSPQKVTQRTKIGGNSNDEVSNVSLVGQKLQPHMFKNTTDSRIDIDETPNTTQYQTRKLSNPKQSEGNHGPDSARAGQGQNQFKHQIEVMVLSKVDPLDSAFPGPVAQASETNLSNSFSQAPQNNIMMGQKHQLIPGAQAQIYPLSHKRNPFKNAGNSGPIQSSVLQPGGLPTSIPGMKVKKTDPSKSSHQNLPGIPKKKGKKSNNTQNQPEAGKEDLPKYGKDFKIPELPPLLQTQLFGDEQQDQQKIMNQTNNSQFASGNPANTQYKIKKFIDDIYQKEMKYRYHKQYVREDFLLTQSPIFDLQKFHHLRPQGNLLSKQNGGTDHVLDMSKAIGLDSNGKPVMHHESQSLTNVLGFQAGGPNVIAPIQPKNLHQFSNEIQSGINLDGLRGAHPIHMGNPGGLYDDRQIFFGANGEPEMIPQENAAIENSADNDIDGSLGHDLQGSALANPRTSHKIITGNGDNPGPVTSATVSKVNN